MGSQILGWTDAVMDTAEVVALGAALVISPRGSQNRCDAAGDQADRSEDGRADKEPAPETS